jgi:hypothetical protein
VVVGVIAGNVVGDGVVGDKVRGVVESEATLRGEGVHLLVPFFAGFKGVSGLKPCEDLNAADSQSKPSL